ncbi:DUF6504 family protein [Kribbella sp. NPDC048915]|uniref:DUF6504 family protein n=1 Tax=Kribbella sp. NPDC048915 TaxID=3155148 RepID=UPI00340A355B
MWEIDDAVEVHSVAVDGVQVPDQFLWRGRLWRVRAVRSQWTETAVWWERGVIGTGHTYDPLASRATERDGSLARIDAATVAEACSAARTPARAHTAGVAAAANPRSRPAAMLPAVPAAVAAQTATAVLATSPAAVGVLDADWGPERTVFRLEAGCGRSGGQEMFDLAHDPHSGRWQLERVTDR